MLSVHCWIHCIHRATWRHQRQLTAVARSPRTPRHRRRRRPLAPASTRRPSSLAGASTQNSKRLPPPAPPTNRTRHPSHSPPHRPQAQAQSHERLRLYVAAGMAGWSIMSAPGGCESCDLSQQAQSASHTPQNMMQSAQEISARRCDTASVVNSPPLYGRIGLQNLVMIFLP